MIECCHKICGDRQSHIQDASLNMPASRNTISSHGKSLTIMDHTTRYSGTLTNNISISAGLNFSMVDSCSRPLSFSSHAVWEGMYEVLLVETLVTPIAKS